MVVVEDVADRSDLFENNDEWEKEGIFGNDNLKEMSNFDVDVGTKEEWEEKGIFIHIQNRMMKMKMGGMMV
eukprot:8210147-Ditylum_brightwellii.AAC.1